MQVPHGCGQHHYVTRRQVAPEQQLSHRRFDILKRRSAYPCGLSVDGGDEGLGSGESVTTNLRLFCRAGFGLKPGSIESFNCIVAGIRALGFVFGLALILRPRKCIQPIPVLDSEPPAKLSQNALSHQMHGTDWLGSRV